MPPESTSADTGVLFENDYKVPTHADPRRDLAATDKNKFRGKIVWLNVGMFLYLHVGSLYGVYLIFTSAKIITTIYGAILAYIGGFGITAGVHRLWSHRAYKAKWPLQMLLMIFNTIAFQDSIYDWSRDHRVHHKYTETNADPYNSKRGFFFSHMGWLMTRKHPDVKEKGKNVDMSDLEGESIVMFQHKYYLILMPLLCFIIPTVIPLYLWDETLSNAWFVSTLLRYAYTLHVTWLVNSAAHMWGNKPYDKHIAPSQNLGVSIGALGEGWHNYHHVFPWDYKAAELGNYRTNFTTAFINTFAKIGWAYDLKTVPHSMIRKRVERTGDGSRIWGEEETDKEYFNDEAGIEHRKT